MSKTIILSASPKRSGNSATITNKMHTLIESSSVHFLSDFSVLPCVDCGYCSKNPSQCLQDKEDKKKSSKEISEKKLVTHDFFNLCELAENIIIVSPIYFYHAPAQLKALLDRSQRFWNVNKERTKKLFSVSVCARQKGEKLSQGLELSYKYFAPLIGANFVNGLTLYGLENKDDFLHSTASQNQLINFIDDMNL